MIPLRPTALCTAGILMGFAAGWHFKPAAVPGTAGQGADGAHRKAGLATSLAGRPVGAAGETWLDAAAADAAAVRGAARPGEANQVLLDRLGAVLAMPDPVERLARWSALLPLMRMEDAGAIRDMLWSTRVEGRNFTEESTAFWRQCGRLDPITALAWAAGKEWESGWHRPDVLGGWAYRDSAAAISWLRANPDRPDSELGRRTGPGFSISGLMKGLAAQSPQAAVELLLANGDDPLFEPCLDMAADLVIQQRGITAALQWFSGIAASDAPATFKSGNLETLLRRGTIPADGAGTARKMELARTAARYVGERWFSGSASNMLGIRMGELDPIQGVAVMERFRSVDAKEYFADSFMRGWFPRDADSVGEWLSRNRASPSFDTLAFRLAVHLSEKDPEAARRWAAQISDPVRRGWLEKELSVNQVK